ncbi:MAG TPA: hypothetical protein VHW95_13070 [Steroidobacteraceae bacterium]|jgi:hypothetical protein|nr:hypothetical protein [Steroidobacteraceae bacterium]
MTAPQTIAGHAIRYDASGQLMPWTSWTAGLDREMNFYQRCPFDHGYPRFACETFLDAGWTPSTERTDIIPSTQNGMGILSYLKFHGMRGEQQPAWLATARLLGDYLLKEALTPDSGKYPAFTRSTGKRAQFPQPADCGSQSDRPYEVQPDKGGIAGYALALLFEATGDSKYLVQALRNARVLAANQQVGDAEHSPWPFRVDWRSGEGRGPISGNMSYILRLYEMLAEHGYEEFSAQRQALWQWVAGFQIPSAAADGALFAQFFEDHDTPTNRSAWAPLNLARYLLERGDSVDRNWREQCRSLIEFVRSNFTHREYGILVCHEQDEDRQAWGGVNSTYGAVLALYAKAVESAELASEARQALNFTLYSIDEQGRPRDLPQSDQPGGWQEDAHTDVIHNYVDALSAFPHWGNVDVAPRDLLNSDGSF